MSTRQTPTESVYDLDTETAITTGAGGMSKGQVTLVMVALCFSVFLAALDITIITTALPTIATEFHSTSGYVWVGSAFLLAAAASTPNWGKLSDIWGRKPALHGATAAFFLGSTLCGAATSLPMIIVGRAIQGIGAGGLLALVNIVIGDLFSQRERGKYYGLTGIVWAVAATLGPVVGGALTNNASWRWCFYLNLPVSGAVFFVIAFALKMPAPKTPFVAGMTSIDWLGSATLTGGILMVLLGLQLGGSFHPWGSSIVVCLLVFGVVALVIFAVIEQRLARYPILPLHLFADVSNMAVLLVDFCHGVIYTQCAYFLPLYFQAALGASPLLGGVWLLPCAISISLAALASGIYIKKTGRYLDPIRGGLALTVLGTGLLCILPETTSWAQIIVFQILAGAGVGFNMQSPLIALQSSVHAQYNAAVTASYGLIRNVASAVAVVVGSVIFGNTMSAQEPVLRATLGDAAADLLSGQEAQGHLFIVETFNAAQQKVARHALYESTRFIWVEAVCFAGAGLLASLFVMRRSLTTAHEEVKTGIEGEEARRAITQALRIHHGPTIDNIGGSSAGLVSGPEVAYETTSEQSDGTDHRQSLLREANLEAGYPHHEAASEVRIQYYVARSY